MNDDGGNDDGGGGGDVGNNNNNSNNNVDGTATAASYVLNSGDARETMTICNGRGYANIYDCHCMSGWQKVRYLVFKPPHWLQFNQYNNSYRIGTILEILCVAQ